MGLFKKESEIIDYTDRGKNVPEIKLNYGVTKDGFIEFKDEAVSKTSVSTDSAFDFLNTMGSSVSNNPDVSTSSSGSAFDFLDSPLSVQNNASSFGSLNSDSEISEIKKNIRNVSSMSEQNSNDIYQLMQRIDLLEKKIRDLGVK